LPAAFFHLGVLQFEQKQFEPAEKHLARAVALDPQNYLAQNFLGRSLRETGKLPDPSPLSSLHSSFGRLNRTF